MGSYGALGKISDVMIFPQFYSISTKLYGNYDNQVGIKARAFHKDLPNFKNVWLFDDVNSATFPLVINLCWFHGATGQAEDQGFWSSCFFLFSSFENVLQTRTLHNDI